MPIDYGRSLKVINEMRWKSCCAYSGLKSEEVLTASVLLEGLSGPVSSGETMWRCHMKRKTSICHIER